MKFELASERRVSWNVECPFFPKNAVKQWPRAKLGTAEELTFLHITISLILSKNSFRVVQWRGMRIEQCAIVKATLTMQVTIMDG